MRLSFILSLLISLSFVSFSSEDRVTISGTIRDEQGNPVALAMVAIENSSQGAFTDSSGSYSFQSAVGKQVLVVSVVGYNTIRKEVVIRRSETLDFTLEENALSLEAVQVYSKSSAQQIREKVYAASSLNVQPIAATLNSLNALVDRASGIRIRQDGGEGSNFNLSINGLSGNAVRYFIDGVPISSMGSGVSLANLPVNLVERVEVFKGVVPAELGEDALGGAVNVITRRDRGNYVGASVGAGSFHTYKADMNAQYVHERTGFTLRPVVGVTYSKNDYTMRDVEVWNEAVRRYIPSDMKRFHDGYRSALARFEAGFSNRTWADEAFVGITFSSDDKQLQTGQKQSIVIGQAVRSNESLGLLARYSKRNFLLNGLAFQLFFSHTTNHTVITDTSYRAYAWDGSWSVTSFSEVTGRERSIRHYKRPQTLVRANFNYTIDTSSSLNLNYLLNAMGNRRYDDFDRQFIPTNDRLIKHVIGLSYNRSFWNNRFRSSIFVKDYIFQADLKQQDLYWLTGINDVEPSATRNHLGAGAGGRFFFVRWLSLKASYERSVRLPGVREFLGDGQTIYPNFKLNPETANNLNIGGFGEWRPSVSHVVQYEGGFFIRRVSNYILRVPVSDRQSQFANVAAATVRGIEGELSYEYASAIRVAVNATYLAERNQNRTKTDGSIDITYNNRMPNRPWFYANAEMGWNIRQPLGLRASNLRIDYVFRYIHWFYLTWEAYGNRTGKATIPTQYVSDAAISWSFVSNKYAMSLECTNIFNQKLYDNYMLQNPGRAFFGKLRIFIN
ncbi:MAG: TonB-dependent receptor [Bacteroidales bacterium]|nr:TonB-dependent receptor [Bacteroidales bacterium]MBN2750973.1 TonB-dependent receptor [Bacteroidales bacterium]